MGYEVRLLPASSKTRTSLADRLCNELWYVSVGPDAIRTKVASNSFIRAVQQVLQPIQKFCDSYLDDLATVGVVYIVHAL